LSEQSQMDMRAARDAAEPKLLHRLARKIAKTVYRAAGIARELRTNPYCESHHRMRCVYIHVPKTGGNAVTQMIYGLPSYSVGGHIPARTFLEYSPSLFANYFVFATIRDPFERLRSTFHFLKAGGLSQGDRRWAKKNLAGLDTFRDFVTALDSEKAETRLLGEVHLRPQSDYLCDASGRLIVNRLVKVENFQREMRAVCEEIGATFSDARLNVTVCDTGWRDHSDSDLKPVVRRLYAKDYEILNYDDSAARF